ncbi:MAG TPA: hypothetical protein VFC98_00470 [Clostridia bacterium]|nr:hypothetical protein [Clostridia bacterium]
MNELTERLLAEGYTKDNHPDNVYWSNWSDFEYTSEYLAETVWEAPCGLLKNGIHNYNNGSCNGITYCPENNNPRFGCPYHKSKQCEHKLDTKLLGWNCVFHQTDKPYDYNNSVEKVNKEFEITKRQKRIEFYAGLKHNPTAIHCNCIKWDEDDLKWIAKYDPWNCARNCVNKICVLTGKNLNGKKGNVFYDLRKTKTINDGSLLTGQVVIRIIKSKTAFEQKMPLPICEAYAELCQDYIIHHEEANRRYFERNTVFKIENIRAETKQTRGLAQDKLDAKAGIIVEYESDLIKAKKQTKKEQREKRKEQKEAKLERKIIENWERVLYEGKMDSGEPADDSMKEHARNVLKRKGVSEQLTFLG